jgi:hypothetical protein
MSINSEPNSEFDPAELLKMVNGKVMPTKGVWRQLIFPVNDNHNSR